MNGSPKLYHSQPHKAEDGEGGTTCASTEGIKHCRCLSERFNRLLNTKVNVVIGYRSRGTRLAKKRGGAAVY